MMRVFCNEGIPVGERKIGKIKTRSYRTTSQEIFASFGRPEANQLPALMTA